MSRKRFCIFLILFFLTSATFAQDFEYGVVNDFKKYPRPLDYYVEKMQEAGFTSFRAAISWQYVEKQKGKYLIPLDFSAVAAQFDKAPLAGLRPIFVLGYGNRLYDASGLVTTDDARLAFANYAKWVANRFKGRVKYYEIWNEWFTGSRQFGDKSIKATVPDYVKLVAVTAAAIREVDPSAVIIAGGADGSNDWFDQYAAEGGLQHVDGISIHPYNFTQFYKDGFTPESSIARIRKLHDLFLQKYGKDISFYVTEVGWPTSEKRYTDEAQAAFIQRYYLLARSLKYIRGVWWYELSDNGSQPADNEQNFGMLNYAGEPKTAYGAFSLLSKKLKASPSVVVTSQNQKMSAHLSGQPAGENYRWVYEGVAPASFLKSAGSSAFRPDVAPTVSSSSSQR